MSATRLTITNDTESSAILRARAGGLFVTDEAGDIHGPFTKLTDAIACVSDLLDVPAYDGPLRAMVWGFGKRPAVIAACGQLSMY